MSICWNWKVLQMRIVLNAFLSLGKKKRDLKHSFEVDEMPCFSILKVKHFWFSFWNYFPFIFFIILCAINMTQNQGKLRHDISVCWKWTALNYLKGYYFFNFHCRELLTSPGFALSGTISESTRKWDFCPPQNPWGHEVCDTAPNVTRGCCPEELFC